MAYNEELLARPEGFTTHPKLERNLLARRAAVGPGGGIDWAHAESLAFASLLAEGTPIRLTGQDAERGTFSQRHLVLHDAVTGSRFVPLHAVKEARASFAVYNSPLSEAAVLGFEYGYSGQSENTLILWEAQFGDFANAGQVIIDQFISAARAKWRQHPWMVLLLPHGYEGQGPEHSSGRLERFLQLAGGDNLRVANCTTAAQYFHLLRLQVALRDVDARPLVLMTPKSLLRHPLASSRLTDLAEGSFQSVIDDETARTNSDEVTRLILCTGKVYVDVVSNSARPEASRVAVVRVEQLYPFPGTELQAIMAGYPNLREIIWLQEEPKNMGAWSFMAPRLRDLIGRDPSIDYIGRPDRASPAEGSPNVHQLEQARIVAEAFSGLQGPPPPPARSQGVKQHAR
ncbi:MAG: 2-oxoglutarate dehydrogenase, subunit, partial [Chloroflexi bacterium]|nr:2-oxoglutarate dehydrogenase, subunit [Chloroflexota bacterium]